LFQPNIVNNEKYEKYFKWFHFAEKSRNTDNKEEDFQEFLNDDIFMEMIQRLSKTALKQDDFEYITNFETFSVEYKRWQDGLRSEGHEEGKIEANEKSAEKCLILGLSIADTMKISNLSLEEVQKIAKRLGLID
jgi:hypothetical protein